MINNKILEGLEQVTKEAKELLDDSVMNLSKDEKKFFSNVSKEFKEAQKNKDVQGLFSLAERVKKYSEKKQRNE